MGADLTGTPCALACPACGAALREGAPWCTLCYADLRPAPVVPAPDPAEPAVQGPVVLTKLEDGPSWPCTRCATHNGMGENSCRGCGAGFLDDERAAASTLVLPVVGDVLAMSRGRRLWLALAAVLIICVPLAVLTLQLTHRPPEKAPTPVGTVGTTGITSQPGATQDQ